MFRLYSKGCEYAIRALVQMRPTEEGQRFQVKEICEKADIPESFTRKIFQYLVSGGFLDSIPGPGGGYTLTKASGKISLLEIIEAVDGNDPFEGCVLGLSECNSEKPCPLHESWSGAKMRLIEQLEAQTLQDLMETAERRERSGT